MPFKKHKEYFIVSFFCQEAIAEEERRQAIARQKIECVSKVPSEPDVNHPDAIHIVIKLPCGERLDRRFLKTHSLEVLICIFNTKNIIYTFFSYRQSIILYFVTPTHQDLLKLLQISRKECYNVFQMIQRKKFKL